jgi:hypothetical protein
LSYDLGTLDGPQIRRRVWGKPVQTCCLEVTANDPEMVWWFVLRWVMVGGTWISLSEASRTCGSGFHRSAGHVLSGGMVYRVIGHEAAVTDAARGWGGDGLSIGNKLNC